ncbi:PA3496 family putative envelope integrity protein [Thalassotalea sp. PLHSN55]|uniref:PA3496 family putative envelope integrity protein n=1 Tax=Thalassotalea sp. PLHSN55 TaxID=3435888 RepID=UPI003F87D2F3
MSINSTDDIRKNNDPLDYEKDLPDGEVAIKNAKLHKRLDDLMEEKRLKKLLEGTDDDWDL